MLKNLKFVSHRKIVISPSLRFRIEILHVHYNVIISRHMAIYLLCESTCFIRIIKEIMQELYNNFKYQHQQQNHQYMWLEGSN